MEYVANGFSLMTFKHAVSSATQIVAFRSSSARLSGDPAMFYIWYELWQARGVFCGL